jgi:hypothetical protein
VVKLFCSAFPLIGISLPRRSVLVTSVDGGGCSQLAPAWRGAGRRDLIPA